MSTCQQWMNTASTLHQQGTWLHREADRQARCTNRAHGYTGRQAGKHVAPIGHNRAHGYTGRQAGKHVAPTGHKRAHGYTGRQTGKRASRQAGKWAGMRVGRQVSGQAGRYAARSSVQGGGFGRGPRRSRA